MSDEHEFKVVLNAEVYLFLGELIQGFEREVVWILFLRFPSQDHHDLLPIGACHFWYVTVKQFVCVVDDKLTQTFRL